MDEWGHVRRGYRLDELDGLFGHVHERRATFINPVTVVNDDLAFSNLPRRVKRAAVAGHRTGRVDGGVAPPSGWRRHRDRGRVAGWKGIGGEWRRRSSPSCRGVMSLRGLPRRIGIDLVAGPWGQMSGGWLFGYIESLQEAGVQHGRVHQHVGAGPGAPHPRTHRRTGPPAAGRSRGASRPLYGCARVRSVASARAVGPWLSTSPRRSARLLRQRA